AGVNLPRAIKIFGLHQHRVRRIQCVQHVEFVLAAKVTYQNAAFGRREGAVVDHHLGNLAIVTVLRLVELLPSEAIAATALVADRRLVRGNHFTIRAQGIAQAVLNLHRRTCAGRADYGTGETAVSGDVQRFVEVDLSVVGCGPPANVAQAAVEFVRALKGERFPLAAGVSRTEYEVAVVSAALDL